MRERNGKAKPKRESKSDWNARPSVSCSPRLPLRLTLLVYPFLSLPPPSLSPRLCAPVFLALKHLCCLILRSCFIFALIAATLQWLQTCSPSPRIATIRSVNFFILHVIRLVYYKPWTFTFSTTISLFSFLREGGGRKITSRTNNRMDNEIKFRLLSTEKFSEQLHIELKTRISLSFQTR